MIFAAVKFADFFSFRDHRAHAGGRVERRNSRAGRAHAFGERALGIELDLDLSAQHLLLEQFVFADVAGDHFLDLMRLEQQAEAGIHRARVVRGARQIFRALAAHGGDQVFGNAAGSESARAESWRRRTVFRSPHPRWLRAYPSNQAPRK